MTETSTDDVRTARVTFIEYHRPALPPGQYVIEVTEEVEAPRIKREAFTTRRRFTVAGERFMLRPADIYAVFPPDGSLGDHSDVLPHIVLNRSTVPWEQSADGGETPWLALLLFTEDESLGGVIEKRAFAKDYPGTDSQALWDHLLDQRVGWLKQLSGEPLAALVVAQGSRTGAALAPEFAAATGQVEAVLERYRSPQVVTLGELTNPTTGPVCWPGLRLDTSQHLGTDKVTVIDVEKRLLSTMLPNAEQLRLLTHVRRAEDSDGKLVDDERAVVLGSRLPKANGISVVHLVSVEGRYSGGGFTFGDAAADAYIRLISLKSWRFACVDPQGSFSGLLTNLDRDPSTLRLPHHPDEEAERHLSAGYLPIPHQLRQSSATVSWYHGPLIPCATPGEISLPAETASALVRYEPALGMFDVSYAAAWELGRLLALQSKELSAGLYNWKRSHTQALRSAESWLLHPGWAQPDDAAGAGQQLPPEILAWFDDLRRLRGVPFNYLVPDETMLPPESIRFVQLDHSWIDCLADGAFSPGRLTGRLKEIDHQQKTALVESLPAPDAVSGFLLRSSVVAGWPGLLVDAYGRAPGGPAGAVGTKLDLRRVDRLSPDVLLALFSGEVSSVQVHLKPETLHFGTAQLPGNWRSASGVVDVGALATALRTGPTLTSADFAARVVEGVPRVTFELA
jgi:hypothetical protein